MPELCLLVGLDEHRRIGKGCPLGQKFHFDGEEVRGWNSLHHIHPERKKPSNLRFCLW